MAVLLKPPAKVVFTACAEVVVVVVPTANAVEARVVVMVSVRAKVGVVAGVS